MLTICNRMVTLVTLHITHTRVATLERHLQPHTNRVAPHIQPIIRRLINPPPVKTPRSIRPPILKTDPMNSPLIRRKATPSRGSSSRTTLPGHRTMAKVHMVLLPPPSRHMVPHNTLDILHLQVDSSMRHMVVGRPRSLSSIPVHHLDFPATVRGAVPHMDLTNPRRRISKACRTPSSRAGSMEGHRRIYRWVAIQPTANRGPLHSMARLQEGMGASSGGNLIRACGMEDFFSLPVWFDLSRRVSSVSICIGASPWGSG
jgi:hypothetical protein